MLFLESHEPAEPLLYKNRQGERRQEGCLLHQEIEAEMSREAGLKQKLCFRPLQKRKNLRRRSAHFPKLISPSMSLFQKSTAPFS